MYNNTKIVMDKAEIYINIVKELDRIYDLRAVRHEIYLPDIDLILRNLISAFKMKTFYFRI